MMPRAVILRRFGSAKEALDVVEDHPKPKRRRDEVLIQVYGTSLNPIDCKTRRGEIPKILVALPKVLGGDVSGKVVESDSEAYPIGTRVMALTNAFHFWVPWGCYCEFVSVPERHLVRVPDNVDLLEAAGVPLVSVTASMALNAIKPRPRDRNQSRILIHGGSGGVGSMCIQLAKHRGYEVYTTCSGMNTEFCKQLGADHAIDYTSNQFWNLYEKGYFDAIVDVIGGDVEQHSLKILDPLHGTFVCVLNTNPMSTVFRSFLYRIKHALGFSPSYHVVMVSPNQYIPKDVAALLDKAIIRPVVSKIVPLSDVVAVHDDMDHGVSPRGKVVLSIHS